MARKPRSAQADSYVPPSTVSTTTIGELIGGIRQIPEQHQARFGVTPESGSGVKIWVAGDASLVKLPCVAIVGSRKVTAEGANRTRRLARELSAAGVVVVSGLARGVDSEALNAAIAAKGRTIAVIGTPIDRAYPAENKRLQETIYREHLLISQFAPGRTVYPSNFPERNKLMAAISDATVIVEASDESGSLHQAIECTRLGRWLFIIKSLAENPTLRWPKDFLQYKTTRILNHTSELLDVLQVR
jgi:DNA processing protein